MKVMITGITGFVGSSLARTLAAEGAEIFGLARNMANLSRLAGLKATVIEADVTVRASLDGTNNVLAEIEKLDNPPRVLYVSSPGVLGPIAGNPADETAVIAPSNVYERSKAAAEMLVQVYANSGLPVVIARPEFIYGPRDTHVLGLFQTIQQGRFFYIDHGRHTCHPTYIDDAVNGMLRCMKNGRTGEIYHIAGPDCVTFAELATTIAAALDVPSPSRSLPRSLAMAGAAGLELATKPLGKKPPLSRDGVAFFSEDRCFSWQKAQQELGYTPQFDLKSGIQKTVAWYKKEGML